MAFDVAPVSQSAPERILEAACDLIAADGIDEVRIARVARRAGASTALVHHYFSTREELLEQALIHSFEQAGDERFGEQLFALVDDQGHKKLLLNFTNVEYLSSAALGKFITLNKKVTGAGGKLVLCGIDPTIYEVFEITRLNKLFNIQKDEQSALQSFCVVCAPGHPSPFFAHAVPA